jgi:hypothetical protein
MYGGVEAAACGGVVMGDAEADERQVERCRAAAAGVNGVDQTYYLSLQSVTSMRAAFGGDLSWRNMTSGWFGQVSGKK